MNNTRKAAIALVKAATQIAMRPQLEDYEGTSWDRVRLYSRVTQLINNKDMKAELMARAAQGGYPLPTWPVMRYTDLFEGIAQATGLDPDDVKTEYFQMISTPKK